MVLGAAPYQSPCRGLWPGNHPAEPPQGPTSQVTTSRDTLADLLASGTGLPALKAYWDRPAIDSNLHTDPAMMGGNDSLVNNGPGNNALTSMCNGLITTLCGV